MPIEYKKATETQLIAIKAGKDQVASEQAKHELDMRVDRKRFWRSFFFPNVWAVLSLLVALYVASKK